MSPRSTQNDVGRLALFDDHAELLGGRQHIAANLFLHEHRCIERSPPRRQALLQSGGVEIRRFLERMQDEQLGAPSAGERHCPVERAVTASAETRR